MSLTFETYKLLYYRIYNLILIARDFMLTSLQFYHPQITNFVTY